MTDPNYNALLVVLDRSGSMTGIHAEMQTGDEGTIFVTQAGETVDLLKWVSTYGDRFNDRDESVSQIALLDIIRLGILDNVIGNSDRHTGGLLSRGLMNRIGGTRSRRLAFSIVDDLIADIDNEMSNNPMYTGEPGLVGAMDRVRTRLVDYKAIDFAVFEDTDLKGR